MNFDEENFTIIKPTITEVAKPAIIDVAVEGREAELPDSSSSSLKRRAIANLVDISGSLVTCQVTANATAPRIGDFITIKTGRTLACAVVHRISRDLDRNHVYFNAQLIGEISQTNGTRHFSRGINLQPPIDAPVFPARRRDFELIYKPNRANTVLIGCLQASAEVPALLGTDELLGKHFAIIGSTGAGKSCALTVLLSAVLNAHERAHVVLIDPHNEYFTAFGERANRLAVHDLELPYWLMTFEEFATIIIPRKGADYETQYSILKRSVLVAKRAAAKMSLSGRADFSVDAPVPFSLNVLKEAIKDLMGKLNKPTNTAPHQFILERIENIENDKRFRFLAPQKQTHDSMVDILSSILRLPVNGKPLTIVDISGVPSEVVNVVVSLLSRMIFEFKVWAPRSRTPPVLLVCEEAHRYVPNASGQDITPAQRAIDQIAREGRKYGVGLGLISQRPADLSPTSLSQCGTIVTLRLTSERDQEFVKRILPEGSSAMLGLLPTLGTGEAIVVGEAAPLPMQISFSALDRSGQPNSGTPSFSKAWTENLADEGLVKEAVLRWRGSRR